MTLDASLPPADVPIYDPTTEARPLSIRVPLADVQVEQSDDCELCRARIGHNRDNHQRNINDSIQSEGISRHIRGLDV